MDFKALRENGGLFLFLHFSKKAIKRHQHSCYIISSMLFMVFFALACKTRTIEEKPVVAETPKEQGAFVNLKLQRDSINNKTLFKLAGVTVVDTKLRYVLDEAKAKAANFIQLEFVYSNGKSILVNAEHPLFKRFDLYEESGKIESKSISLSQGELFVKVPYYGKIKRLVLRETINYKMVQEVTLNGNEE